MRRRRPLIGVISDRRILGLHPFQIQGEKYLTAVVHGAGGYPVGVPCLGAELDVLEVLDSIDGLLLTGSPSNVQPRHYDGAPSEPGTLEDPERDQAALALIPAALRAGLPVLAICRGFQELNVAFGGSLHPAVHMVDGLQDHREDKSASLDVQYGPAHRVSFAPGGVLQRITGREEAIVNSVHSQGIDCLADGLMVEAVAPDGLIEAVTLRDALGFNLAVQWHPEWRVREDDISMALFQAFGDACRSYRS